MHFWIDKRSQQCGFGRSRVAASLSGSGGGVGLGFCHPPRRIHSANKSTSTASSMPTTSGSNQISAIHSTSRLPQQQHHHHHHHHHHNLQQQQCASTSASTASDHSGSRNNQQIMNNNIFQTCTANSRNIQAQHYNQVNNNAHQVQIQHPQHHQQFNTSNARNSYILATQPNTANNNQSQRGNGQGELNTSSSATQAIHHHNYHHDIRYHHPQFGNMSVRHLPVNSNANTTAVNIQRTNSQPTVHTALVTAQPTVLNNLNVGSCQSNTSTPYSTNLNIVSGQPMIEPQSRTQQLHMLPQHVYGSSLLRDGHSGHSSRGQSPQQQQQQQLVQQPTNRQSLSYQTSSPRTHLGVHCARTSSLHTSSASNLLINNVNTSINNDNRSGSPAICNEGNPYHHQHAHHRQLHALIDTAETQLLPSHLKSGVCASLLLASIFVAAAKFYFDHQNSGMEVLIFIAFSMTFLLAACTASLCRIPRGIIVQRPSGLHGEHALRTAYSVTGDVSSGGVAAGGVIGHGGNAAAGVMLNRNDHSGLNSSCQQVLFTRSLQQEHTLAAQAGPPPYHIAILLPENGCKDEEESPPPSYDKILI